MKLPSPQEVEARVKAYPETLARENRMRVEAAITAALNNFQTLPIAIEDTAFLPKADPILVDVRNQLIAAGYTAEYDSFNILFINLPKKELPNDSDSSGAGGDPVVAASEQASG